MRIGRGDAQRRQMALNSNAMMLEIERGEEDDYTTLAGTADDPGQRRGDVTIDFHD